MVWRLIVCLVLFSYIIQSKAGYCVQSDFTNLSRIKGQCTDSPPMAVILNPLSPKSDHRQISPCDTNAL